MKKAPDWLRKRLGKILAKDAEEQAFQRTIANQGDTMTMRTGDGEVVQFHLPRRSRGRRRR